MTRPNKMIPFMLTMLLSVSLPAVAEETVASTFPIQCGVNISHWLYGDYTDARNSAFTEWEVRQLREWGFDFIRLPVGEDQLFHEDGTLDGTTMSLLVNALTWCKKYRVRVILDFHILRSHEYIPGYRPLFTSASDQQRLCDMWTTMATRLKSYGADFLAFELLNEPAADYDMQWNVVAAKVISAIRAVDTERILVVSSNRWALAEKVSAIRVPDDDPNIMLTCHFYEPMLLTHYKAAWREDFCDVSFPSGVHYPGKLYSTEEYNQLTAAQKKKAAPYSGSYDKAWMRQYLRDAISYASRKGRMLLLGEFGCLPSVEQESRMNWINDFIDIALENQLPHAYWEYKSAFGFCYADGSLKNETLKNALVRKELSDGISCSPSLSPIGSERMKGSIYNFAGQCISSISCATRHTPLPRGLYIGQHRKWLVK